MIFLHDLQDHIKVITLDFANLAETSSSAYNKNAKWESINRIKIIHFWDFIISIWLGFCMVGQPQNDHFDMVLQSMQKDHGAWFRNQLPQMLKVGIRMFWSKMTICICGYFYFLFLFLFLFVQ